MDPTEFEQVRKTFPWSERTHQTIHGGLVQVLDCNGQEVPIFTMTRFLTYITGKLYANDAAAAQAAQVPEPQVA